jgi:hypothetical protein
MKKLKLLGVVAGLIAIAAIGVGLFFGLKAIFGDKTPSGVQSKKEITEVQDDFTSFNSIISAYNAKDYAKTIKLAEAFGKDDSALYTEKLNTYSLCMQAARSTKDAAANDRCFEAAKQVAATVPDESMRKAWIDDLTHTHNGTVPKGESDGPQ